MGIYRFFLLLFSLLAGYKFYSPIITTTTGAIITHHHQLPPSSVHNLPREEIYPSFPYSSNYNNEDSIHMKKKISMQIPVPKISTHATSSSFPQLHKGPQAFSSEIEAMVDIVRGFQWHEIVFLHQDSGPSNQFASQLVDAFKGEEILISNKISISSSVTYSSTIKILTKLLNIQTRIILVDVTDVTLGSQLALAAKEVGLMSKGYAWLITSRMSTMLNSMDQNTLIATEGALGIRPHLPRGYSGNIMHSLSNNVGRNFLMSFEVFNVLAKVERVVGFWSPRFGFSRDLGTIDYDDVEHTNKSVKNFKKIIWPGDSTMVPRSCDVPTIIRSRGSWRRRVTYY